MMSWRSKSENIGINPRVPGERPKRSAQYKQPEEEITMGKRDFGENPREDGEKPSHQTKKPRELIQNGGENPIFDAPEPPTPKRRSRRNTRGKTEEPITVGSRLVDQTIADLQQKYLHQASIRQEIPPAEVLQDLERLRDVSRDNTLQLHPGAYPDNQI